MAKSALLSIPVEGFSPVERTSSSDEFVDQAIEQNVREMVAKVRENSSVLADLEQSGQIKIVGATYDLHNGKVTLLK